ncbi:MAG: recombinase family protein, partial [Bacteroidales bacterium]|nr:recombinase family protein [Candidatus Scybalousia scybalohippi]
MAKNITVIPATRERFTQKPLNEVKKRRTCGYARVSTDNAEQLTSYESQMAYYENFIKNNDDMEFVGMYSDEGITATSTKHRDGFNQMIDDALAGKIDLIITKSVSRFARNTVDSLTTVRKLKEKGVEIYFEKENIWTLDSKGELLITIMSSLAQEESRSISENTTWGQRKRMADGHGCIPFKVFMGYDKGPDGEFVINEEQADVVRRIFTEYLDGNSTTQIARHLERDGIKTVTGKTKWDKSVIISMLRNEKYKGDCLMQKTYTESFLTKKQIKNRGEVQQYYVKDHHEPIVSEEMYDAVQLKLDVNGKRKKQSGGRDFSSKVFCGDCGAVYGSKVWHSTDKYKKVVYRCNKKYDG